MEGLVGEALVDWTGEEGGPQGLGIRSVYRGHEWARLRLGSPLRLFFSQAVMRYIDI